MIVAEDFVAALRAEGYSAFAGVPCSYLKDVFTVLENSGTYTPAPHEGIALAMCVGHELAGTPSAVFLQNSGIGNLLDPLTSLVMSYQVPALMFVSLRGWPDEQDDEPHHAVMGRSTIDILEAVGVETVMLAREQDLGSVLARARKARARREALAVLTTKDTFCGSRRPPAPVVRPAMGPNEAVAAILVGTNARVLVSTTGMISRELYSQADAQRCFYMQGSMGHAIGIGLGLALERPEEQVVVLDGDGAILMHLGGSALTAELAPASLLHVVLDNASYASTGGQRPAAYGIAWEALARAMGYRTATTCDDVPTLRAVLSAATGAPGPHLVAVRVGPHRTGLPRISERWSNPEIFERVRGSLARTAGADATDGGGS